jgi:hypothetical protein
MTKPKPCRLYIIGNRTCSRLGQQRVLLSMQVKGYEPSQVEPNAIAKNTFLMDTGMSSSLPDDIDISLIVLPSIDCCTSPVRLLCLLSSVSADAYNTQSSSLYKFIV